MDGWWGGRVVSPMLPRLFFQHFHDTSFAAVPEGSETSLVGFLVGFVSPTRPGEGYIHFVGVHPEHRHQGVARALYERFFEEVRARGCDHVTCITSPANAASIAFHRRMGFRVMPGDAVGEGGIPVTSNYDGRGNARVRFLKDLAPGCYGSDALPAALDESSGTVPDRRNRSPTLKPTRG